MSKITVGTPFAGHGFLYLSSGFILDENRPVYAVKPGASGDITLAKKETQNEYVAWKQNQAAAYIPSSLLYGDYYYVLLDQGFLTCYDAKTGEEVYDKQRLGRSKSFTASPWAYNGNIFCLSEDGDTTVIEAGPEYKVTGVNDLEEFSMATPAIANGSLYLRTASHLFRIQAP
jgi:outer membrane protein assembly factor BamB